MDYLVFRLYGPMASWGEIAVGESRHTANYPSKSAICGLVGAALGVERSEEVLHGLLAEQYLQAIKVLKKGQLLKDYHTAQAPDSVGKFRYRTRRDEIVHGKDRLGTILSSREYRTDAQAVVALQALDAAPFALAQIQQALKQPILHLYLGRKSCPLAAPLNPQIITAKGFREALDNYELKPLLPSEPEWVSDKRWLAAESLVHYYWEGSPALFADTDGSFSLEQVQTLTRHDKPLSRKRWQFQTRKEYLWLHNQKEVS